MHARKRKRLGIWACLTCALVGAAGLASGSEYGPTSYELLQLAGDPIANAERYGTPDRITVVLPEAEKRVRETEAAKQAAIDLQKRLDAARTAGGLIVKPVLFPHDLRRFDARALQQGWNCELRPKNLEGYALEGARRVTMPRDDGEHVCVPSQQAIQVSVDRHPAVYPIVDGAGEFRLPASWLGQKILHICWHRQTLQSLGRAAGEDGRTTHRVWLLTDGA
jgi:hypothetical protein